MENPRKTIFGIQRKNKRERQAVLSTFQKWKSLFLYSAASASHWKLIQSSSFLNSTQKIFLERMIWKTFQHLGTSTNETWKFLETWTLCHSPRHQITPELTERKFRENEMDFPIPSAFKANPLSFLVAISWRRNFTRGRRNGIWNFFSSWICLGTWRKAICELTGKQPSHLKSLPPLRNPRRDSSKNEAKKSFLYISVPTTTDGSWLAESARSRIMISAINNMSLVLCRISFLSIIVKITHRGRYEALNKRMVPHFSRE